MAEFPTLHLSLIEKRRLIGLYQAGIKQRVIARTLNLSKQTVNLWITRLRNEGTAGLVSRERSGWPRETTADQDMAIITASKFIFSVATSFCRLRLIYVKRYYESI